MSVEGVSERKLVECIEMIRDKAWSERHSPISSSYECFSEWVHYLFDNLFWIKYKPRTEESESFYVIKFGRVKIVCENFPYGNLTIKIMDSAYNEFNVGTVVHDMSAVNNTFVALGAMQSDFDDGTYGKIRKIGIGLFLLLSACDYLNRMNLPPYAWVPTISPEAMEWLRRYEIGEPTFEPTAKGLELLGKSKVKKTTGDDTAF